MEPNQQTSENHTLCPSNNTISEGQRELLTETHKQDLQMQPVTSSPSNNQPENKEPWFLLAALVVLIMSIILGISLINTGFGSLIGYPIIISALSSILAGLLCVSVVEIINNYRRPKQ